MDPMTLRKGLAMAGFGAVTAGAATVGMITGKPGEWYRGLRKPWFQPPPWIFAPVWTGLYGLIAASGYRVWSSPDSPERTRALALWAAQLGLNAGWSILFFGRHDVRGALVDLGLLRLSIEAYTDAASKVDPLARRLMAPYRGWTTFAALLNTEIARLNPQPA